MDVKLYYLNSTKFCVCHNVDDCGNNGDAVHVKESNMITLMMFMIMMKMVTCRFNCD